MDIEKKGPRLAGQIERLDALVREYSTPVQVYLLSDKKTEVVVYRVGTLGKFDRHALVLRPGTYTVVRNPPGLPRREASARRQSHGTTRTSTRPLRGGDVSWRYVVREANGTRRRVEASAFPLSVGGPDPNFPVAGAQTEEPLAHFGLSGDEVFVQPASEKVRVNGTPVKTSQWLRDRDVIAVGGARIQIEAQGGDFKFCLDPAISIDDKKTDPPVIVSPPRDY